MIDLVRPAAFVPVHGTRHHLERHAALARDAGVGDVLVIENGELAELDDAGVRAIAICPGFVDTPMAQWTGITSDELIQPEDCAEVVRMCLRLSPSARIPQVVIERVGSAGSPA